MREAECGKTTASLPFEDQPPLLRLSRQQVPKLPPPLRSPPRLDGAGRATFTEVQFKTFLFLCMLHLVFKKIQDPF